MGQSDRSESFLRVPLEQRPKVLQMPLQGDNQVIGKGHDPVLASFTVSDEDGPVREVQVLDSKPNALQEPESRAVLEAGHQPAYSGQVAEHARLGCSRNLINHPLRSPPDRRSCLAWSMGGVRAKKP